MANVETAVRDADVIVTATNAIEPFLKGTWVKPGALVNAVGSPRPTWRELDDQLLRQFALIVDSHGIRYLIPDTGALDATTRGILERYL